jgi:hypothetical protein
MIKGAEMKDRTPMDLEDPFAGCLPGVILCANRRNERKGIIRKIRLVIKFRKFVKD